MHDILTITPNPALDLWSTTAEVRPGPKLMCTSPRVDPGGGGVNVSRAIAILGGRSRALVAAGGPTGDRLCALIRRDGIDLVRSAAPGDTRQNLSVTETTTNAQYRFTMPGPVWTEDLLQGFIRDVERHVPSNGIAVFSGSLMPGSHPSFLIDICNLSMKRGARALVDTSQAALRAIASAACRVSVLRMDHHEAEHLAERSLPTRGDVAGFAEQLVTKNAAETVIVAMGAEGSLLVDHEGTCLFAAAAPVTVTSKIGAGDSFMGAFTLAISRKLSISNALQAGMAAASAAVMTEGTALCSREMAERLWADCPVTVLEMA